MDHRYVIRQETNGAYAFDRVKGLVFALTEPELLLLRANSQEKNIRLPDELTFFYKSAAKTDRLEILPSDDLGPTSTSRRNFVIREPLLSLGVPAASNCLSAPNRIYLELTRRCNLRCKMCYNASGQALPNELTTNEFKSLLEQMSEAGVFEARFTGGEPTQRPDFFEILDYAIAGQFYVSLATNAVWNRELIQEICRRKIDDVVISLEGSQEINDRFRVGGSYKMTLETIRSLKEAGFQRVRINTVLSTLNWQRVEPLFQICQEYDLLLIDFIHPRPFGRGSTPSAQKLTLSARETLECNHLIKKLRQKYPGVKVVMDFDLLAEQEQSRHPIVPRIKACPAGREFAFVSPQGYVFPCGVAPIDDIALMSSKEIELFIAGNVLEKGLVEIWHRAPAWEAFRDLAKCKPPECFSCEFWGRKCFGTCPIGAYYYDGRLNGRDPYCYAHLLHNEGG